MSSGQTIITDGPKAAGGVGESMSPSDLLAAALASCALTIMALCAESLGADFSGCYAEVVEKEASMEIFRVTKLKVRFYLKQAFSAEVRQAVEAATTEMCIVGRSLHPDIKQIFEFVYQ